jgi:hypothetical protein
VHLATALDLQSVLAGIKAGGKNDFQQWVVLAWAMPPYSTAQNECVDRVSGSQRGGILLAYESRWRIKNGNVRFA